MGGEQLAFPEHMSVKNGCKEKKFLDCFLSQANSTADRPHRSGRTEQRTFTSSTRGFGFQPQVEVKALGRHRPSASRETSFDMMLESWIMLNLVLHAGK